MIRTARSRLPLIIRGSAVALAVGSVAMALTLGFPLVPPALAVLAVCRWTTPASSSWCLSPHPC